MLTNGSLQGVTILKDKILEDNTGVACHPDMQATVAAKKSRQPFFCGVFGVSFVFCSKKGVERPFFDDYLLNLHRENMHLRSENHATCVHVADL